MKTERVTIHNDDQVRALPAGRRMADVIVGRKWVRVRPIGATTFKRVALAVFEKILVKEAPGI